VREILENGEKTVYTLPESQNYLRNNCDAATRDVAAKSGNADSKSAGASICGSPDALGMK